MSRRRRVRRIGSSHHAIPSARNSLTRPPEPATSPVRCARDAAPGSRTTRRRAIFLLALPGTGLCSAAPAAVGRLPFRPNHRGRVPGLAVVGCVRAGDGDAWCTTAGCVTVGGMASSRPCRPSHPVRLLLPSLHAAVSHGLDLSRPGRSSSALHSGLLPRCGWTLGLRVQASHFRLHPSHLRPLRPPSGDKAMTPRI